ncbi:uncharacterized protein IL334_000588 [Kwoniella shivajii]|uniref:Homologous-pairing protein 2 winged helix domain-containing protein n=1 Tax=Kwoniella shivajii TaxID=564305 RepID=A0ABZ1CR31_9TREE|nr:hypothetical protein IL334_000588 [Kwoniella shivajii]
MAPKKEVKEKQVKGDEAEEMVLEYMREQNRPYANADVSANLKNRVPKAAAVKVLATLAERGQLTVKPYGKQLIYLYNQSLLEVLAPKDLSALDSEIKETKNDLEEKRKKLKTLQTELANKEALPKTKDLTAEIERVKADNEITLKALAPFRASTNGEAAVNPMSTEDIKKIDVDFTRWRKEWAERRKVYKELLGMLIDAGQVDNVAAFEEDQGIVGDDDDAQAVEQGEFVKIPAKSVVKRTVGSSQKGTSGGVKRDGSNGHADSQDDGGGKRKKAKKA